MTSRLLIMLLAAGCAAVFAASSPSQETLNRYLKRGQASCSGTEQRMELEIEASLPSLEKHGTMKGLKIISKTGQVAYRFLRFTGDKLVKTDVIVRFLTAEARPTEPKDDVSISLQNYKFHFLRTAEYYRATAYVFQVRPRKKRVGLFKGELWLDAASAEPLREAGELAKSPSIFIRRVQFVREYRGDGSQLASCGQPERMSINVQTRIVGDAEMVVRQHPAADSMQEITDADDAAAGIVSSPN